MNATRFLSMLTLLSTCFALHSVALAQALGGVPWSSGGQVSTGGSYDLSTGMITREVVDFEVPGSVGLYPLRCARTLSTHAEIGEEGTPYSIWHFEHYYTASGGTTPSVVFPSGRKVTFRSNGIKEGVGDRLEFDNRGRPARLRLSDGGIVEFTPLRIKSSTDPIFVGTTIRDPHGVPTTVEPFNEYWPRRITDASGRWISFEFEGERLRAATSSAGQRVAYVVEDQIGVVAPIITAVDYGYGSSASYRYAKLRESCSPNLPLELRDDRADSKIPHIRYEWDHDRITASCALVAELSGGGVVVSTRESVGQDTFFELLPSGRRRRYLIEHGFLLERTDAFGHVWKYHYDEHSFLAGVTDPYDRPTRIKNEKVAGKITEIEYPDKTKISYEYTDPQKPYFIHVQRDERGNPTTYRRFPNGVVERIDYPDNTWESWAELTPFAQTRVHTLRNGAKEYFEYDVMGRLVTHWHPTFEKQDPRVTPELALKVGRTRYAYYPDGHPWEDLLESETDPRGLITRYEYARWPDLAGPPVSGLPLRTKTTYADESRVLVSYDRFGNKVSETNEEDEVTTYKYDAYNRLTAKHSPAPRSSPLERITQYDYTPVSDGILPVANVPDAHYSHTSSVPFATTSPEGTRNITAYDDEDRVLLKVDAAGTSDAAYTRFEYDKVERVEREIDPERRVTSFEYDDRDRKTWERQPGDRATHWKYDASGNIDTITYFFPNQPEVGGQTYTESESFQYDEMNNRTEHTDERGKPTIYKFEGGKLSRIFDPEKRQSGFDYDASGRVTQRLTPASDGIAVRIHESFAYDLAGNLVEHRDRRGVTESIRYKDNRNWEELRSYTDGTPSVATPLYDRVGRPKIRRTIAADPRDSTLIEYDYDGAGRVWKSRQKVGNHRVREITYHYDRDDREIGMVLGDNLDIDRRYTARGQLKSVFDQDGLLADYGYFLDGQLREKSLYNKARSTYRYDNAGRLEIIEDNKGASRKYKYDDRDRLLETTTERGFTEHFGYFPDSQLRNYRRSGAIDASQDDAFIYDDSGNRLSSTLHGEYVVDGTNQYRSVTGHASEQFGYDAVGNLTSRTGWTYDYDARWRITRATASNAEAGFNFTYDAEGRLVGIRDPKGIGKHALYDGSNAIAWFDDDDDDRIVEASVWGRGDDEPLVTWRVENREGLVYHLDRQHSVVQLSDQNGMALEGFVYGAFGAPETLPALQPFAALGKTPPPYLYTSQRWLPALSLYHYRARAYDPNLGRFLQTDPAGIDAGDLNLYRYVENSPTNYTDPSGNQRIKISPQAVKQAVKAAAEAAKAIKTQVTKWANAVRKWISGGTKGDPGTGKGVEGAAKGVREAGKNNNAASKAGNDAAKATKVDKPSAAESSGGGRAANKLKADPKAAGPHSTFKKGQDGNTSNYATYEPNPKNPSGFQETKRVDVTGKEHRNPDGTVVPTPHVKEAGTRGVRPARPEELP